MAFGHHRDRALRERQREAEAPATIVPRAETAANRRTDRMVQRYAAGQSLQRIARAFHLAPSTVYARLKARGVQCRLPGPIAKPPKPPKPPRPALPAEEVIRRYRAGETTTQLAAAYACSVGRVYLLLQHHGVPRRSKGAPRKPPSARQWAMAEMYIAGATLEETGTAFSVTRERVRQVLRKCGVPSRLFHQPVKPYAPDRD